MIEVEKIEKTINYKFNNPDLLRQAFVRSSATSNYSASINNEVLIFVGDSVLDTLVTKILMDRYGRPITIEKEFDYYEVNFRYYRVRFNKSEITSIKLIITDDESLADYASILDLPRYMVVDIDDYGNSKIEKQFPGQDLFKSVLGAVFIDCNKDYVITENVLKNMIDFDDLLDVYNDTFIAFFNRINIYAYKTTKDFIQYKFKKEENNLYTCYLNLLDINKMFTATAISRPKAGLLACKEAYFYLRKNGYLKTPIEEFIGEVDELDCVKQLTRISGYKYVPHVKYIFNKNADNTFNCQCLCGEKVITKDASTKEEAQRKCAFLMLKLLIQDDIRSGR